MKKTQNIYALFANRVLTYHIVIKDFSLLVLVTLQVCGNMR